MPRRNIEDILDREYIKEVAILPLINDFDAN